MKKEGSELVTNCNQLKMLSADGKRYFTDVADTEQILRLIQSIPSPKAEPFKLWMAKVAAERIDQIQDPELSTKEISESKQPSTFDGHKKAAKDGGEIARNARIELEEKTGKKVITRLNAQDGILLNSPKDENQGHSED